MAKITRTPDGVNIEMETKKPTDEILKNLMKDFPFTRTGVFQNQILDKIELIVLESYKKGFNSALDEVEKIIDNWYDTSIKDKNSKVALMITNGGYMNKIDFKEKIKEMRK